MSAVTVSQQIGGCHSGVSALATTNELRVSMAAFHPGGRLRISLVRITDRGDLRVCLPPLSTDVYSALLFPLSSLKRFPYMKAIFVHNNVQIRGRNLSSHFVSHCYQAPWALAPRDAWKMIIDSTRNRSYLPPDVGEPGRRTDHWPRCIHHPINSVKQMRDEAMHGYRCLYHFWRCS